MSEKRDFRANPITLSNEIEDILVRHFGNGLYELVIEMNILNNESSDCRKMLLENRQERNSLISRYLSVSLFRHNKKMVK
jgi:hypothetical protein